MAAELEASLNVFLATLTDSRDTKGDFQDGEAVIGLAFALTVASRRGLWKSQLLQDAFVLSVLGFREAGTFVEIGVGDGLTLSNSAVLEAHYGWKGLLVEPNPTFHAAIRASRPDALLVQKAVLAASSGDLAFRHVPHWGEISSLEKYASGDHHDRSVFDRLVVETIGAADLFTEENVPRDLDYLSIDIEGPDSEVLESILQAGWRPKIITIEHNFSDISASEMRRMLSTDYKIVLEQSSKWDFWAVRVDILEACIARLRFIKPDMLTDTIQSPPYQSPVFYECERRAIIVDVGMHVGENTDFYLEKGFNVIAIEANAELCDQAICRFAPHVRTGQLRIVHAAVAATRGRMPFYINTTHTNFSSLDPDAGRRFGAFQVTEVQTERLSSILAAHSTPYFIKLDIEGTAMVVLRDLMEEGIHPRFMSVQGASTEAVRLLASYGYDAFKFLNQATIRSTRLPAEPLEGKFIDYQFSVGASGPFGEETSGSWKTAAEIEEIVEAYWQTQNLDPSKHGWFDLHARSQRAVPSRNLK